MISKKDKFIYIHIPRTGGTSVQSVLQKYMEYYEHPVTKDRVPVFPKHASLVHLLRDASLEKPSALEDYFVFSFVRNPWDLVVSRYHLGKCIGGAATEWPDWAPSFGLSFEVWVKGCYECHEKCLQYKGCAPLEVEDFFLGPCWNQVDWLTGPDNSINLDFVGRFENLKTDFATALSHARSAERAPVGHKEELTHMNSSEPLLKEHPHHFRFGKTDYRPYYTDDLIEIVGRWHKRDIEYFNYSFDNECA